MNDNQYCLSDECLKDDELGNIRVRVNVRARRMIFRGAEGGLVVTVPLHTTWSGLKEALERLRPRLRTLTAHVTQHPIDSHFRIDADHFHLEMVASDSKRFQLRAQPDVIQILYPRHIDFAEPHIQEWLKKAVTEAMRIEAYTVLPPLLSKLARRHGLTYHSVKINTSTGRWGSCSARQDINLSCRLLLLPHHLIEYVLLHELAHTREMNHSDRFWALLDSMTDGKALELRAELKHYPLPF